MPGGARPSDESGRRDGARRRGPAVPAATTRASAERPKRAKALAVGAGRRRRALPGQAVEISWQLPRRNVEVLQLEIRRLARRHGLRLGDIRIEQRGGDGR